MAGLSITALREVTMLLFEIGLPSPEPLGISGGRLTVTISGPAGPGQPIVTETSPGSVVVRGPQLVGNHGDSVHAEFVYLKRNGKPFLEIESSKVELFEKVDASTFEKP